MENNNLKSAGLFSQSNMLRQEERNAFLPLSYYHGVCFIVRLQLHNFLNAKTSASQNFNFPLINFSWLLRHVNALRLHSKHYPPRLFQENVSVIRQYFGLFRLRYVAVDVVNLSRNEHGVLFWKTRVLKKRRHIKPVSADVINQIPQRP